MTQDCEICENISETVQCLFCAIYFCEECGDLKTETCADCEQEAIDDKA